MAQDAIAPLDPDTTSGSQLADKLIDNEQTLLTQHSGSSRPSYAQAGTRWIDTTTNPWLLKEYDGVDDIILYKINTTSHRQQEAVDEATIASSATTDVLGSASKFVSVTGSATITSFGSEPNQIKFVRAAAAATFTITHNATTLILPTGADITVVAGATFIVTADASGNARVFAYQKADGSALSAASSDIPAGTVALFFQTAAPTGWTKDTSNFNDHAIRIVTGTPSSGGSLNFSTVFGYTSTSNYTLTTTDIPAHTHGPGTLDGFTTTESSHNHSYTRYSNLVNNIQAGGGTDNVWQGTSTPNTGSNGGHTHGVTIDAGVTGSTGSGGAHAHAIDMRTRYVDAIRATRN